jgi:hypothetical protein
LKYIYTESILLISVFAFTWLFQIIHSACEGTKPPQEFKYFLTISLAKLFFPSYFFGCPWNFTFIQPRYFILTLILLIVIIEVLILEVQKYSGAKFLIPKRFRILPYNYYIKEESLSNDKKGGDCCICLDKMVKLNIFNNITRIAEKDVTNNDCIKNSVIDVCQSTDNFETSKEVIKEGKVKIKFSKKIIKHKIIGYLDDLKHVYKKTKYMETPCKHTFHSECLESWMNQKSECPYCRTIIPPLE